MVCRKCFLQTISSCKSPPEERKEDTMVEGVVEEVSKILSHLCSLIILIMACIIPLTGVMARCTEKKNIM